MTTKILKPIFALALTGLVVSCDFAEKNIDPNENSTITPGSLLTYTQINTTSGGLSKNVQVGTCMMLVQQTASLQQDMPGDKYYMMDASANTYFNDLYSSVIKNWRELTILAEGNPRYDNTLGAAKIWGAYLFQRITDLYGDVPYSEAGTAYYTQNFYPKYDKQEDIYTGIIQEIKDGLALLSKDKVAMEGDLFYNGDIDKWKKFGNSLLLRVGMRLSEVAPDKAKQVIIGAVQGGVMSSPEDICMLKHYTSETRLKNPLSYRLIDMDNYIQKDHIKIGKTFMDYLMNTNDPRISVYCSLKNGDNNPAIQRGLPNGHDNSTIGTTEGYTGNIADYSNFNTKSILKMDAPTLFMMPSETKLLLSEAVLRGWIAGDASALYKEAIKSSMKEQYIAYGDNGKIADTQVEVYLAQNLFDNATTTEKKLEVIGEQYWVATFMNGFESYANWRRTGYPKLTPANYAGSISPGVIPTRIPYAMDEYTINKANVEAANQHQGPDKVTTHVWWDTK